MSLLKTYDMRGLFDFILFLLEQEQEDILWDIWLNKDIEKDFKTFKRQYGVKTRPKTIKPLSDDHDQKTIAYAQQFMKPKDDINEKGGDE